MGWITDKKQVVVVSQRSHLDTSIYMDKIKDIKDEISILEKKKNDILLEVNNANAKLLDIKKECEKELNDTSLFKANEIIKLEEEKKKAFAQIEEDRKKIKEEALVVELKTLDNKRIEAGLHNKQVILSETLQKIEKEKSVIEEEVKDLDVRKRRLDNLEYLSNQKAEKINEEEKTVDERINGCNRLDAILDSREKMLNENEKKIQLRESAIIEKEEHVQKQIMKNESIKKDIQYLNNAIDSKEKKIAEDLVIIEQQKALVASKQIALDKKVATLDEYRKSLEIREKYLKEHNG